jgi:hypothetical protein
MKQNPPALGQITATLVDMPRRLPGKGAAKKGFEVKRGEGFEIGPLKNAAVSL